MPTIHDLMQATKTAVAAKQAAQAAGVVAKTEIAAAAEAVAGGAGEGAVAITQAAAAGGATAAGEQGNGASAAGAAGAEAAAGAAAPVAAAAAPVAALAADTSLNALVGKVTELSISNAKLTTELDAMTASCVAMIAVVSDSLDRMSIALGGGKVDVSKLTPEALVGLHTEHAAKFAAKFPIGGVAAVNVGADDASQEAQRGNAEALAMHAMRVAAAGGQLAAKK
jgi:hypothetical protein